VTDAIVVAIRKILEDGELGSKIAQAVSSIFEYVAYIDTNDRVRLIGTAMFTENVTKALPTKCKVLKQV
jgi:hypothetical protein